MSSRVLLCDLCIILLYGLSFILAEEKSNMYDTGFLPDCARSHSRGPLGRFDWYNLNGPRLTPAADDGPKGNCSCGGFPSATIETGAQPLLSQNPGLVVKCDDEGSGTCKSLCNALATATKAKGPEVLCIRLKNAMELKLSAFYQVCDKPWTYADITADVALCCEESKVKTCPSAEKANATTPTVDTKLTV